MRIEVLEMVRDSLFYRSFCRRIKGRIWETLGVKLLKKRNILVVQLLSELKKEFKISNSARGSDFFLLGIGVNGNLAVKIFPRLYNQVSKRLSFSHEIRY
jgi:hypothetical protein